MKKSIALTLMIVMLFSNIIYADSFDNISNELEGVLIGDFETGRILSSSGDINEPMEIASITKLMTYLVTKDEINKGNISLEDIVTVDIDFNKKYPTYNQWSKFYLWKGEKLTLKTLIDSMMIPSANDSAIIIARYVGGSKEEFVKMMNDKAKELGLDSSNFLNSNGFPENGTGNTMSIKDIFILARHIINKYPEVLEITNTEYIMRHNNKYYSTNPLLPLIDEVDGLKTGYTKDAGYCLVSTLLVDDDKPFRLIGVSMGANSKIARRDLGTKLVDYEKKAFNNKKLISKDEIVGTVEFKYGKDINADIMAENDYFGVIKKDSNITKEVTIDEGYEAPRSKGEKIGKVTLIDENNQVIGETDVVLSRDVEKANVFVRLWRYIKSLFTTDVE